MGRMKDHLYDIHEGKENIDEILEQADELLIEIEGGINELEEIVELPTGEKIKIDKIELKELEKLPFEAIY